mgnify:FL=1
MKRSITLSDKIHISDKDVEKIKMINVPSSKGQLLFINMDKALNIHQLIKYTTYF